MSRKLINVAIYSEAWLKLGQLSRDQARTGFVELLSRRCPLFTTFVEAHRRERDEQKRQE